MITIRDLELRMYTQLEPLKYEKGNFEYVTIVENYKGNKHRFFSYFSDEAGHPVDSKNQSRGEWICKGQLNGKNFNSWNASLEALLHGSNLSNALSEQHTYETLVRGLTNDQFQIVTKHLTDDQLQVLVNHLTDHQLKTLAQELN